jgi:hypothetical protein
MRTLLTTLVAALALSACTDTSSSGPDAASTTIALRAAIGPDVDARGLAVDARSGRRFLLDGDGAIYELFDDATADLIWSPPADLPPLTDLCALGGGRFIGAADGDGYWIDSHSGRAEQHFCLEPGWDPGFDPEPEPEPEPEPGGEPVADPAPTPPLRHLNRSVACDVAGQRIYGQPQTVVRDGDGAPLRSEVASYDLRTGADLTWQPLPDAAYHAGGMALLDDRTLLLAAGSQLWRFDLEGGGLEAGPDLAADGARTIEGIAVDIERGVLLVLDAAEQQVLSVPLERALD